MYNIALSVTAPSDVQHIHLDHTVYSLCIHEMILHRVLGDLLRVAEDSLPDDKLGVSRSHGLSEACTTRHCCVAGHHHGGALVPREERWEEETGRGEQRKRKMRNRQVDEEDEMVKEVERRKGR